MPLRRHVVAIAVIASSMAVPAITMPQALGAPTAAQTTIALYRVSCPKTGWCMAVGASYQPAQQPLAEVWNGRRWHALVMPALPRGDTGLFSYVSCQSSGFCVAVGTRFVQSGQRHAGLVEQWNGKTWRIRHLALPADALLGGVSCVRRTCVIVGAISARTTSRPLAAQLTGTRLRVLRPRVPAGSLLSGFDAVSCVAPSRCMAVGGEDDPKINNSGTDLAEVWNGTAWRIMSTPHPKDETALLSVSCASAATCLAAGWPVAGTGRPLALTLLWAAGRWRSLKTTGSSSPFYEPQAVSCDGASSCVTAGFVNGGHGELAAEKWNGRTLRFMLVSTRSPGQLFGISCPLPTRCVAVGGFARPGAATRDGGIAELWNGTRWRSLPVAGP